MRVFYSALSAAFLCCAIGCGNSPTTAGSTNTAGSNGAQSSDKLETKDIVVGKGNGFPGGDQAVAAGDTIYVWYTGKLKNGTVFDTNVKEGGIPYKVIIGQGAVIKGWDEGLIGMKAGGDRSLTVPPALAYGDKPQGANIPANSTLYFDVKLVDVVKQSEDNIMDALDKQVGTGPEVHDGDMVTVSFKVHDFTLDGHVLEDSSQYKKGGPYNPLTIKITAKPQPSAKFIAHRGIVDGILGDGQTIKPMHVGGTRFIRLPPGIPLSSNLRVHPGGLRVVELTVVDTKQP